jgi:superfamily II DNA or RNA helicase
MADSNMDDSFIGIISETDDEKKPSKKRENQIFDFTKKNFVKDINFAELFEEINLDDIFIFPFGNKLYLVVQRLSEAIEERGILKWYEVLPFGNKKEVNENMINKLRPDSDIYNRINKYIPNEFNLYEIPFYFVPIVRETYVKNRYGKMKGDWKIKIHKSIQFRLNKLEFKITKNKIKLRDYQQIAHDEWHKNSKFGTINLATAGGKTVLGIQSIYDCKLTTLIAVPTQTLMKQWKKEILNFLEIPEDKIGFFYGNKKENKPILIGTYNSLEKYIEFDDDERQEIMNLECSDEEKQKKIKLREILKDFLQNNYSLLILDECLIKDTIISMKDGSYKNINDIENGDEVVGGIVSNVFNKEVDKLIEIETSFGKIITSENHPNLIIEKRRFDKHINQYVDSIEQDIRKVHSKNLKEGYFLLIPEKLPKNYDQTNNFKSNLLYFVGMIMCDGHLDKKGWRIKAEFYKRDKIEKAIEIFGWISKAYNTEYHSKIVNRDGKPYSTLFWILSKPLKQYLIHKFNIPLGKKSNIIDIVQIIFTSHLSSIRSFIQSCFDCEGWLNLSNKRIGFASTSKIFTNKLQLLLLKFSVKSAIRIREIKNEKHNNLYQLDITGEDLIRFSQNIGFTIKSKKDKLTEILKKKPNRRLTKKVVFDGNIYNLSKIKSIKIINKTEKVFDFTTTSHYFIANGFLTHNSHHIPAPTFRRISLNSKALCRLSLSATTERFDGNESLLYFSAGKKIFELDYLDLCDSGWVVPFFYKYIPNFLSETDIEIYRNHGINLEPKKKMTYFNTSKLFAVIEIIQKHLEKDHQILIFGTYIDSCYKIYDYLTNLNIPCGLILSEANQRKKTSLSRDEIIKRFSERKINIIVSTTVLDEGFNVPNCSCGIIISGSSSTRQMIQRVGRIVRQSSDTNKIGYIYELTTEGNAEVFTIDQLNRLKRNDMIEDSKAYKRDQEIFSSNCWTFNYDKINKYANEKAKEKGIEIIKVNL